MTHYLRSGIMLLLIFIVSVVSSQAQDTSASKTFVNSPAGGQQKVLFAGAAIAQYQYTWMKGSTGMGSFSPLTLFAIPLIKVNDNLFLDFAAQLDVNSDGSATPSFDELVVYYRINPYLYAFGGDFNPKYGVYYGVLDDFTNRFGTGVSPVGMNWGVGSECGIGLQGAAQTGYSKIYYQLYLSNGPQLSIDNTTPLDQGNTSGQMVYGPIIDNNKNKNVGWAIGYLPFSNSSLEVNFSGAYTPKTGNLGDQQYETVDNLAWAVGLNYYHIFRPVMIRAIGEYDKIQTKNTNYSVMTSDTSSSVFTYDNQYSGWFYGMTIKDAVTKNKFLRNLELGARVGGFTPPVDAPWGGQPINQTTLALTYWLNWDIPLSFEYDIITQSGAPTQNIFSTVVFFRF